MVKGIFVTYFSVFYEIGSGSPKKLFRVIDQTRERDSAKENAPNFLLPRQMFYCCAKMLHIYDFSNIFNYSIMISLNHATNGNCNGSSLTVLIIKVQKPIEVLSRARYIHFRQYFHSIS
jgi:hypothetical protein